MIGDVAIASGYYTFCYGGGGGGANDLHVFPARFTFVYRRGAAWEDGLQWEIVDHHTSKVPDDHQSKVRATRTRVVGAAGAGKNVLLRATDNGTQEDDVSILLVTLTRIIIISSNYHRLDLSTDVK